MNVIIIEDEYVARENLKLILSQVNSAIHVLAEAESISESIAILRKYTEVDLIFLDIELADGNAFQIFEQITIETPIIFTTAYTEYAIKAFELNSIDYLLKPITETGIRKAIDKFQKLHHKNNALDSNVIKQLLNSLSPNKNYKHSFLIEQADHLIPVKTDDFAFFYIENGLVKGVAKDKKIYFLNDKLDSIETQLNPKHFYRVNRQFIIQRETITKISNYFNGKLVIHTQPNIKERIIVSRAKASAFKEWLNSV